MTASERYLSHLKRIIDECDDPARLSDASGETLGKFFDEIAVDRIRICKTDWQGHGLSALLWNLPSLKPSSEAALIKHVIDRWDAFKPRSTTDLLVPDTVEQHGTAPFPTDQDQMEPAPDTHSKDTPTNPSGAFPVLTDKAVFRRDWFDRLTDWVAAVVTLWKQT